MCAFKCVIVEQRYMRQSAWVSGICIKCVIVGNGIKRLGYVLEPAMQSGPKANFGRLSCDLRTVR